MIRLREMEERDLPAVVALERACFTSPWTEDMFRESLSDSIYQFYVCEKDDEVVAFAGMYTAVDMGDVVNIAVRESERRQGIAEGLLDLLIFKAAEADVNTLMLEVRESNAPAIALYEKKGFYAVGRRRGYYENPREDAILYTRKRGEKTTCGGLLL